jgi:outer membrane cobalamin receptor
MIARRFVPALLSLLLVSAPGGAAMADDADPGEAPAREISEEIVITGIRTGVLEHEPTAFSNVLFTDDFEAEDKSLADLLSESEGVFVRRFGAAGDRAEVSIRGSSPEQVVVSIDGVRANSALTGGLDLSRVCLPLVDRVEILRGAGATREGSGAVGGSVNLVTRSSTDEPINRVGFSAGSFETYEGSLFRAAAAGPVDYSFGYCGLGTEGNFRFARPIFVGPDGVPARFVPDESERINNDRIQHGASLGLAAPLGPGRLRFGDYFAHSRSGEPGIDCCNGVDAGQNPQARSTDWSNLAQLAWRGESLGRFGDDLAISAYHRYEESDFEDPLRPNDEPIDVRARISTLGTRLADEWNVALGPSRQALGLRIDFANDWFDSDDQPDRRRSTTALTLADDVRLFRERLLVAAALRADWTEGFGWYWIPSLGIAVTPVDWLRIRANLGRAFRVPSFDELYHPDKGFIRGNPNLDPELALNMDAGLELLLARLGPFSEMRLAASWFRRDIDDSIVWVRINDTTIAPVNTGSATSRGVELGLSLRLTRYLRFSFSHTELASKRDDTGRRLPGQPERESHGRVQIGPDQAFKLVGEVRYTGDILVSEGGGRRLPDRTIWSASASINLASIRALGLPSSLSRLWLFVTFDNIGDVAVRDSLAFPQPGRSASAGFEVAW